MSDRVYAELDRGSYLTHYGLLNPWSLWILQRAPQLLGLRPSELRTAPPLMSCPDCRLPMSPRPNGWMACYRHSKPIRRRLGIETEIPPVKWAPGEPSALSVVGEDVDIKWSPERGGYIMVPLA